MRSHTHTHRQKRWVIGSGSLPEPISERYNGAKLYKPKRYHSYVLYCVDGIRIRDVNKDLTPKDQDKDKDLTPKDKDKDLTPKDQDKDKDLTPKDQDKDKDLTPRTRTRTRT